MKVEEESRAKLSTIESELSAVKELITALLPERYEM